MGDRAMRYFDEAGALGGLVARMKLASLAKLTSTEAATVDDSPEILRRLEDALRRLRVPGPRGGDPAPTSVESTVASVASASPEAKLLRRHLATYLELMSQRSVMLGDVSETVRRIDEAAASTIDVERVSVWFLDDARTKITCADLFVRSTRQHASGTVLFAKDFAPYFRALESERTIAAGDAHHDPRTSCFSTVYLAPLGIGALLDVPIWVGDKMVGVVCHEHVGRARRWNSDEETFGYLMSTFVALALERQRRA
jgi:hypothetical protein